MYLKKIWFLFLSLFLVGCNQVDKTVLEVIQPQSAIKKNYLRTITPTEFLKLAKSGEYEVIDVRTVEEVGLGTIFPEVLNIDYYKSNFRSELAKLPKDQPYLVYCRSGIRSGKTLKIMKELGFQDVADLRGGKNVWDQFYNNQ